MPAPARRAPASVSVKGMLLDQKRTKRMVQIVAILTSAAFAGVIFVVLGLIVFGGGGQTVQGEQLDEARQRITTDKSADAYDDLAAAYAANDDFEQAIDAARMSVKLEPGNFDRVEALVTLQIRAAQTGGAVTSLQEYTRDHRRNFEAFLLLGQLSEQAGRQDLARLSYQRFLQLAPDDARAEDVRDQLDELRTAGSSSPAP